MNISGPSTMTKTGWLSETNLRNTSVCKQPPMYSTYSAHKENLRQMQEQRRTTEDWQASNRQLHDSRSVGSRAVLEEMETITLQPIGRGVHDLEPTSGSIARSVRATTPSANRSYAPGWDQQDGFRTIATTNYHREMHTTSGPQSPYLGAIRQNSQYEATPLVANRSENQWKTVTPFSPTGSLSGTNIGTDVVDGDTAGMRQVLDTSKYWYLPGISRPDEAGSFVIRNSNTYADSFGLALKVPPNSPRVISNKEDAQSEWVRHFLIGTVPMHDGRGNGVHLRGFSSDPTFPSLAAFVHYHIHRQGALPCTLRLPVPTNQMLYNQQRTTVNDHTVYGLDTPLQTVLPTATTMYTDMLYLGSVEVDRLENMNAAIRGITQSYSDGLPKRCEVQIKVLPHEGITFTEKYKRGVWKKIIKPNNLLWCGMDPENREFNDIELRSKGVYGSKVFALVARKQRFWLHENVVYVFCEIDNNHPAINLVRFINSIFPGLRD
ncbi:Tensin-4 [Schistosoma japonicum]|nr:Tensin-4 [Schistosoma japonicum]